MGVGGWVESIIRLISAEAEALLCLAELGNNGSHFTHRFVVFYPCLELRQVECFHIEPDNYHNYCFVQTSGLNHNLWCNRAVARLTRQDRLVWSIRVFG